MFGMGGAADSLLPCAFDSLLRPAAEFILTVIVAACERDMISDSCVDDGRELLDVVFVDTGVTLRISLRGCHTFFDSSEVYDDGGTRVSSEPVLELVLGDIFVRV